MNVTFDPNPVFDIPVGIYDGDAFAPAVRRGFDWGQFEIDRANSRFIMMGRDEVIEEGRVERDEIRFVVNWFEELKRLVPPIE